MEFDWEKFKKEKIVVSFKNKDEVYDFAHQATEHGILNVDCCVANWIKFNGEIVFECIDDDILILDWGCSNAVYYDNFTIIKWVKQNEELYPKLKEGMVIEIADKLSPFWYIRKVSGELVATNGGKWFKLKNYNNDLTDKKLPEFDVVKIYESNSPTLKDLFNEENLVLIWERTKEEEVEEMTIEDICKALGKKIKIKED